MKYYRSRPVNSIVLVLGGGCGGDGSGRFRTKGRHSAATVVGTKWLVEDRYTSTLTRVVRGKVSVRDCVRKKTVAVRAGNRYIARAKRS
jgi:ferric-dicitrate binding protein FerR (iron transport regulator)